MQDYLDKYRNWQYKNTALLILSLVLLFFLVKADFVKDLVVQIGNLGYFGSFIVGVFFVSVFTVAPSVVVLYNLADTLNPFIVAILAGLGAVVGDYLIFRFFKDKIFDEIKPIFDKIGWSHFFSKIFRTPFFSWLIPLFGAAIIASPMPDEVGISILGISKVKSWQFIIISFLLNAVGIFVIVTVARSF